MVEKVCAMVQVHVNNLTSDLTGYRFETLYRYFDMLTHLYNSVQFHLLI